MYSITSAMADSMMNILFYFYATYYLKKDFNDELTAQELEQAELFASSWFMSYCDDVGIEEVEE